MQRLKGRARRKQRIRKKVSGTAERPRLTVFRSLNHTYAQVVDDERGVTLACASTRDKSFEGFAGKKTEKAIAIGSAIAEKCKAAGIAKVVFDRNGYMYHGRVKAVAEGARKGGLSL